MLDVWHSEANAHLNEGHNGIDNHGLCDLETHVQEPVGHVVIVWPIQILRQILRIVLFHIGINYENQEASIKELCIENSACDTRLLC